MSKHYIWNTDNDSFLRKTPRRGDRWTKELRDALYFTRFDAAARAADSLIDYNVIIINHDDAVCIWNGTDNLGE